MTPEQIYLLNHRKLEALCGFYSHKDIPFFIHQVLTYFETPIQKKYLISKEIRENIFQKNKDTNEEKNLNNSAQSSSTHNPVNYYNNNPFNHNLNTNNTDTLNNSNQNNKFSFPQIPSTNNQSIGFNLNNNTFNQNSNITNLNNMDTSNNSSQNNKFNFPQTSSFNNPFNQNPNTTNPNNMDTLNNSSQNNKFSFPQTSSFNNTFNQNSNTTNSNNINKKEETTNNTNSFHCINNSKEYSLNSLNQDVLSIIELFNNEHQKHPFIQITSSPHDIENDNENQFLCNIAQDQKTKQYLFASRQIKNKKKNIIYEYKLPDNYSWVSSYKCIEDIIFYIPLMHLSLTQNNINHQELFENIHYMLCAFENLLNNILIPCLKHKELSKYIHPKIKEAITFPIIIAFDNEFKESQYSLKNSLTYQKPKEIYINWFNEEINFKKDVLISHNLLPENELEIWINNCEFKKKCYLYYTQCNYYVQKDK